MSLLPQLQFAGRFDLTMDAKGRVPVPSVFRKRLLEDHEEYVTVTVGPDESLRGYGGRGLEELVGRIEDYPDLEVRRRSRRKVISKMAQLSFDNQGRILVPPHLRKQAQLESDIVYLGCGNYFEIWNRAVWEQYEEEDDDFLEKKSTAMNAVHG